MPSEPDKQADFQPAVADQLCFPLRKPTGLSVAVKPALGVAGMFVEGKMKVRGQLALSNRGVLPMNELELLGRITVNPQIFGGKPIVRGRRLAVEHVLAMLAAGDTPEMILSGYPWLEADDVRACLVFARRHVGHERVEPLVVGSVS